MAITRSGISLEEFLTLPEEKPALEYEDGRVTQKVSPQGKHSSIQAELLILFDRLLRHNKIGRAFPELRTTFEGSSRVPDVAIYRWERIPRNAEGGVADRFLTPPDVAVEIRSPEQTAQAQIRRCRDYVRDGVSLAIMVDPERLRVWIFRANQAEQELRDQQSFTLDPILPNIQITPTEIFGALRLD
jgi:Uma2 family endonuclease